MKYLEDYINEAQTELFDKYGVFFAFSDEQWDDQVNPELTKADYYHITAGMYCPKENTDDFLTDHAKVVDQGRHTDIAENGLQAIIIRELNNYESYYTGDAEDAIEALKGYPVTTEDILKVFKNKNHDPAKEYERTN